MTAPQPRLLLGYTVPDHVRWSAFGRAIDVSCLMDACKRNGSAKRFVPALGDADEAIGWLKEHAHGAKVAEFCSDPDSDRLRAVVRGVIDDLKDCACMFWACPGPDAPFTPMATCRVCASVMDLRAVLDGKALPSEEASRDGV